MYSLSAAEVEEVSGGVEMGPLGACVAMGSATIRVGSFFGPQAGAAAALGGCAFGVALYYWA